MDESKEFIDNLEMLKALYDFKATYSKTLSFRENELFMLHQTSTKQRNWWQVINGKSEIGFVPSNYVQKVKVSGAFLLQFLDECILCLRDADTLDKQDTLMRLEERRRQIERNLKEVEKNTGPVEVRSNTASTTSENLPDLRYGSKQTTEIKAQDVYDLVEQVRINTQLSHEMSRVAVVTILSRLQELLPAEVNGSLGDILSQASVPLNAGDAATIEETHDAVRLKQILHELTECKEDEQQRSWMVHEDEAVICHHLTDLISILSNADQHISRHVMASQQYHAVVTLLQYYQMETRWSIRKLLLQAFGVMCSLDRTTVTVMSTSILPLELSRDMRSHPHDISRLSHSCLLLTIVLSSGEPLPVTHTEHLGVPFIHFVQDNIESPPPEDTCDQIPDLFVNLTLAHNLQFYHHENNTILDVLCKRPSAKTLTEKLLLLFNREEDPVKVLENQVSPANSVTKLLLDMFSREDVAQLFYTNDVKVLIDIIVRQLSDLSPGDVRRSKYLELCRRLMRNTSYEQHKHRHQDIHKCFTRIFCEETDVSNSDQKLVRDITKEFSHLFQL